MEPVSLEAFPLELKQVVATPGLSTDAQPRIRGGAALQASARIEEAFHREQRSGSALGQLEVVVTHREAEPMGLAAAFHQSSELERSEVLVDGRGGPVQHVSQLADTRHPSVLDRPPLDRPEQLQLPFGDPETGHLRGV